MSSIKRTKNHLKRTIFGTNGH